MAWGPHKPVFVDFKITTLACSLPQKSSHIHQVTDDHPQPLAFEHCMTGAMAPSLLRALGHHNILSLFSLP